MSRYHRDLYCLNCNESVYQNVFDYSVHNFGIPLCRPCQNWAKEISNQTTFETMQLYFALRERNVPAELEKDDGFKTIDIAVVEARVNIEVDGGHHNYNSKQALSDLKRTYYSFKKGYLTLRIPNSLVKDCLDETADLITDFLNEC